MTLRYATRDVNDLMNSSRWAPDVGVVKGHYEQRSDRGETIRDRGESKRDSDSSLAGFVTERASEPPRSRASIKASDPRLSPAPNDLAMPSLGNSAPPRRHDSLDDSTCSVPVKNSNTSECEINQHERSYPRLVSDKDARNDQDVSGYGRVQNERVGVLAQVRSWLVVDAVAHA